MSVRALDLREPIFPLKLHVKGRGPLGVQDLMYMDVGGQTVIVQLR